MNEINKKVIKETHYSIVKIIANNIAFDWYNPYRTEDDYESIGTGFFIDENHILTCSHVVSDSIKIYITIPALGKDKIETELVAICPSSDIALIKTKNYKSKYFLKLANATKETDVAKQNDKVIAIGYPLAQDKLKYTSGIISGVQDSLFQTDAPINPGNSGGPLLNEQEEVIAINSAKIASFIADNIGYSIPIYYFKLIEKDMRSEKKLIHKPELACVFQNVDDNILRYYQNPSNCVKGYYIREIYKTSPLYIAGLRANNILCSFNGFKIDNYGECDVPWGEEKMHLTDVIKRYKIGDKIKITYWDVIKQNANETYIHFTEKFPFKIRTYFPIVENIDYEIIGGLVMMNLTQNHLELWSNKMNQETRRALNSYNSMSRKINNALVITNVLSGSYIKSTENIRSGEIIHKINGIKVSTINELRNIFYQIGKKERTNHKDNFILIETKSRVKLILNIDDLIEEEKFLHKEHKYNLSKLYHYLKNDKLYPKQKVNNDSSIDINLSINSITDSITDSMKSENNKKYYIIKK